MRLFLSVSFLAALGCAGATDCEKAAETRTAKFEECGIPSEESTIDDEECTEEYGTQSLCIADCTDVASCDALTGDDNTAQLAYAECIGGCG